MTTNNTRGISTEVATTEGEQRRSQGPRSPIIRYDVPQSVFGKLLLTQM